MSREAGKNSQFIHWRLPFCRSAETEKAHLLPWAYNGDSWVQEVPLKGYGKEVSRVGVLKALRAAQDVLHAAS